MRVASALKPTSESNSSPVIIFEIRVLPVNDQPFVLVTMWPEIEIVQGSARNITTDILRTMDADTPPEGIVYELRYVILRTPADLYFINIIHLL